jgi:ketosteroid isomerase-like protein
MVMKRERTITELETLGQEWAAAELAGDSGALDRLLTDDFVGIGPLGFMLTKQQWLARYTVGGLHYDSFALEEARVRPYGEAAVVTGRQVQSGSVQGRDLPSGGRVTLIWVRQDGRWLLAGWQMSPIAEGA